ncbi:DNA repair protein SWI5 homolog [Pyxicephalus adspersus]
MIYFSPGVFFVSTGSKRCCCRLESPRSTGTPQREHSAVTPRQRSSLRRTPLGNRKNVNTLFKSPVQQPNISQSAANNEDTWEKAISELSEKEASLDKEIAQLEAQGYSLAELDKHISLLHEYNELKDTGQMLMGRLAVLRGITSKDLYSELGMDVED